MSTFFKWHALTILALLLCLSGCSGKTDDKNKADDKKTSEKKTDDGKPRSFVTAENFDRIEIGMMKAQVVQILGGFGKPAPVGAEGLLGDIWMWEEGDRTIYVSFGLDMKVTGKKPKGLH
jgi:hypothetical protein